MGVEIPPLQVHDVLRCLRQRASCGEVPHQVTRRLRKRCLRRIGDLAVSHAPRVLGDPRVDVAGGSRHRPRPHRLAARRLHRVEQRRGGRLALRGIAAMGPVVVITQAQRECVGGAACQHHLLARQPPGHLRQPHGAGGAAGRVHRIGNRQFPLAGHGAGGLGERLLERIGRAFGGLRHGSGRPSAGGDAQGDMAFVAGSARGRLSGQGAAPPPAWPRASPRRSSASRAGSSKATICRPPPSASASTARTTPASSTRPKCARAERQLNPAAADGSGAFRSA